MEKTARYGFSIAAAPGMGRSTVQIVVECDHRYSYAHTYNNVELGAANFTFEAPLTGEEAAAYWHPQDHPGLWSDWERGLLRRMEVKIFTPTPLPGALECLYAARPSEEGEPVRLAWATPLANPVPLGNRFELAFDLAEWHGNPFDNQAFPVVLEVTPPGGTPLRISPFLYQNFEAEGGLGEETIIPHGPKHFLVRYRPRQSGDHAYRLLLRDTEETERTLTSGTLIVTEGTPPDFLRVSTRSPRYFEHADGRFFYAIGWNLPYPVDRPYGQNYMPYLPDGNTLAFKRKLIDDLADAGGNFARFWLSDWWNGLEWSRDVGTYPGLGRYNLRNAWINDQILEHCERRGIYLQFESLNHVRLSRDYGWPQHPYNRLNGGFLQRPRKFWTDPGTETYSRRRLAYIMARYADSPAVHSFNVMSEPDIVAGNMWPAVRNWLLAQLDTIRRLDIYGHITGNQLCMPNRDPGFFREDPVELVSTNAYTSIGGLPDEQIDAIRVFAERYSPIGKPVLIAEAVGHWAGDPGWKMRRDTLGALWAGVASGLAGTPLSWWWNFQYGEDIGRGGPRVVADFMRDEDLILADDTELGGWRHRSVTATSREGNLRALMSGNQVRRFLFAYNFDTLSRTRRDPSTCDDNRIEFGDLRPGAYHAEYWDLRHGRTKLTQRLEVGSDGVAELMPPAFREGWAIKIFPVDPAAPEHGTPPQESPPPPVAARTDTTGVRADWSWRLRPLVPIHAPHAAEHVVIEARIALPDALRQQIPSVTAAGGEVVPFFWEFLEDGTGWRILCRPPPSGFLTVTAQPPEAGHGRIEGKIPLRGLLVTVARNRSAPLRTFEDFEELFGRLNERRSTHVPNIDQLENPLGDNQDFLAVYQGPLLAPVDGDYIFATNSDDGSFVRVNGVLVTSRPGPNNMEVLNRPAENLWSSRGSTFLSQGLHWVEYYHQQGGGASLARLGWQPPRPDTEEFRLLGVPGDQPQTPAFEVVPAWALDGRMPSAVEILRDGKPLLTLLPTLGLELRRPRVTIPVIRWVGPDGTEQIRHMDREGRHGLPVGRGLVPVWAWNPYNRPFSMEWDVLAPREEGAVLRTMLYDIELPLSLHTRGRSAGTRTHARRAWETWPLSDADAGAAWEIRLEGVTLLSARLPAWHAKPSPPETRKRDCVVENLIEASLLRPDQPLAGKLAAALGIKTPPDGGTSGWRRADPWAGDPEVFARQLGDLPPRTGVILRFDQRTRLLGLTDRQLSARLHTIMQVVRDAGAEPVLVLNADIDLHHPATRTAAIAFHRLSRAFGAPFVDLRESTP